jgi:hypothetical protein
MNLKVNLQKHLIPPTIIEDDVVSGCGETLSELHIRPVGHEELTVVR